MVTPYLANLSLIRRFRLPAMTRFNDSDDMQDLNELGLAALYGGCMTVLLHEGHLGGAYLQARKRHHSAMKKVARDCLITLKGIKRCRSAPVCAPCLSSVGSRVCCSANLAAFFSARRRLKKSDSWAEQASASTSR